MRGVVRHYKTVHVENTNFSVVGWDPSTLRGQPPGSTGLGPSHREVEEKGGEAYTPTMRVTAPPPPFYFLDVFPHVPPPFVRVGWREKFSSDLAQFKMLESEWRRGMRRARAYVIGLSSNVL